jgi:hypothetical protein
MIIITKRVEGALAISASTFPSRIKDGFLTDLTEEGVTHIGQLELQPMYAFSLPKSSKRVILLSCGDKRPRFVGFPEGESLTPDEIRWAKKVERTSMPLLPEDDKKLNF